MRVFALVLTVFITALGCKSTESLKQPNIIVIMTDDMGYAGPGCYGGKIYNTPGIDRLAAEGMRFTDFHSSGTVCSPTRAGLMTGRYQQRTGIEAVIHPDPTHPENKKGLKQSELTFAEVFREAGYSTGLIGKWHLGYSIEHPEYHPMNHGFDTFYGFVSGNIDYISHWGDHLDHDWFHNKKEVFEEGYTTDLINKYALKFLDENKDKPFCLYVAHEAPHAPIQGPGDPIVRGPNIGKRNTAFPKSKNDAEAYQYMMNIMDKGVQQIHEKVIELGLADNTLIIFLSDNGPDKRTKTDAAYLRGGKGSVYEGGHRVPAIFWYPGKIKPGTVSDETTISLDIMPTVLEIAGLKTPKTHLIDGVDISPVLFQNKPIKHRPLFWISLSNNGQRSEAIREGDWKLVVNHVKATKGTFENEQLSLFNLKDDLSEQKNIINNHQEKAFELKVKLKKAYTEFYKSATPQVGGWSQNHQWDPKNFTKFLETKSLEWKTE